MQIMTGEEWYEIMWNLMDAEIRSACAYFMAILVIGSYFFWNVWLNAMLAIFVRLNKEAGVPTPSCANRDHAYAATKESNR